MSYLKPNAPQDKRFTKLPNSIFDIMLKNLKPAEFIIYMIVYRNIRGWNKEQAYISYKNLLEKSPYNSYATISKALDGLERQGIIIIRRGNEEESNLYTLNEEYEIPTESVVPPITESVVPPITESVVPPITESVDIKYINKDNIKDKKIPVGTPLEDFIPRLANKPKPEPASPPHSAEEARQRAKTALEGYYQSQHANSDIDVSHYPEHVQEIVKLFSTYWHIKIPTRKSNLKGKWIKDAQELLKIIGDIPVQEAMMFIHKNYAEKPDENRFDVYDIGSILKFANMALSNFASTPGEMSPNYGGGFNFVPNN